MYTPKFYPDKLNIRSGLENNFPKLITKTTHISSMGSCFATNIGRYLIENGYNYILKEPVVRNKDPKGLNPYIAASARWDFVYNTSVMRQIFEYSLGSWEPQERWWYVENSAIDPYRRGAVYKKGQEEIEFNKHKLASEQALKETEVIILTLGLTELWRSSQDKSVFYRLPHEKIFDTNKHEFYNQTLEDILFDLDVIYTLLKRYNPEVKIIITVSPVPFNASFRVDLDVISANMLSKSKLRVAVDEFSSYKDVFYFPSYEFVLATTADPFVEDGRHIKPSVVNEIMEIFEQNFCL